MMKVTKYGNDHKALLLHQIFNAIWGMHEQLYMYNHLFSLKVIHRQGNVQYVILHVTLLMFGVREPKAREL